MKADVRTPIVVLSATIACVAVPGCASSPVAARGPEATTPSTVVTFPSTGSARFVATPVGPHDLSSAETLSIAQRANAELTMPPDTAAIHGVLIDTANDGTPVWAFRYHSCATPMAPIKTKNFLCTAWVFLQSRTGRFIEARHSP